MVPVVRDVDPASSRVGLGGGGVSITEWPRAFGEPVLMTTEVEAVLATSLTSKLNGSDYYPRVGRRLYSQVPLGS